MDKSKVLLIYTGGTIGMFKNEKTGSLEAFDFLHLQNHIPELQYIDYQVDTIAFKPVDSSAITPALWVNLVETIEQNYEKYDGFVILHGTDTMAYSASALSFMIENLNKPVIFTGSQLPIGQLRTDGKENLITSIEIAGMKSNGQAIVQEVCIFFQSKLFRGNRSTKYNAEYFDAFASPNYPPLAEAGINIKFNHFALKKNKGGIIHFHKKMDASVTVLKLFPGMSKAVTDAVLGIKGLKGLVIETYGAGNATTEKWFADALFEARDKKIPVVNITQCSAGSVKPGLYETGRIFVEAGVVNGRDMTTEAAITKLMFLNGLDFSYEKMKFYLQNDLAGEMTK